DRDALLTLGREAVGEEGEVDLELAGSGLLLGGLELVLGDRPGVVQEAPDERALPVVDGAHRYEAEELLVLVALEVGLDVGANEFGFSDHDVPRAPSEV